MSKAQIWGELDELGEEQVRVRLATGAYSNGNDKRRYVQEWLLRQSEERAEYRRQAEVELKERELGIAKSARDAAWIASVLAAVAVLIALLALFFSLR